MRNQFLRAAVNCVAALILFSCNPVKQIQKNDAGIDELKAKWIFDWVKANPCPGIPELRLDSICELYYYISPKDSLIDNPNKDDCILRSSAYSDTGFRQTDTSLIYHSEIKSSISLKNIDNRILVPYEDTRLVKLLQDSVRALQIRAANTTGSTVAKAQDCSAAISDANKRTNKWMWLFVAACVVIGGGIAWKIYGFFHGGGIISKII